MRSLEIKRSVKNQGYYCRAVAQTVEAMAYVRGAWLDYLSYSSPSTLTSTSGRNYFLHLFSKKGLNFSSPIDVIIYDRIP